MTASGYNLNGLIEFIASFKRRAREEVKNTKGIDDKVDWWKNLKTFIFKIDGMNSVKVKLYVNLQYTVFYLLSLKGAANR